MERKEILHRLIACVYTAIVLFTVSYLIYFGFDYYSTSIEERYFHDLNNSLKASSLLGHGFGITSSLFIFFGVFIYMARKPYRIFSRIGILRNGLLNGNASKSGVQNLPQARIHR